MVSDRVAEIRTDSISSNASRIWSRMKETGTGVGDGCGVGDGSGVGLGFGVCVGTGVFVGVGAIVGDGSGVGAASSWPQPVMNTMPININANMVARCMTPSAVIKKVVPKRVI